jgi:hypothetical protein
MEWNTGSARLVPLGRALVHKYCVTSPFSIASGVGDEIQGVKVERGTTGVREVVECDLGYPAAVVELYVRRSCWRPTAKLQELPCWLVEHHPRVTERCG